MSRPSTLAAGALSLLLLSAVGCGDNGSQDDAPSSSSEQEGAGGGGGEASGSLTELARVLQEQTDKNFDAFSDNFSSVEITAEDGSTLVYRYTHLEKQDVEAAQKRVDETREVAEQSMANGLFRQLEAAGVDSPRVREIFLNPDGSTVTDETFGAP